VIFYAIRSDELINWLENEQIRQAMMQFTDPDQVDVDPSFTTLFDFKVGAGGVTKKTFVFVYGSWINLCNNKRQTVKFYLNEKKRTSIHLLFIAFNINTRR
jgi:hypothetical protein